MLRQNGCGCAPRMLWPQLARDLPWLLWYEARLWSYVLLCRPMVVRELFALSSPGRVRYT